jgi:RNA polymerase sigma-70 factor (ECF subfamily)
MDDQELIAQYRKKGNKQLVGELFNRYAHLVFGVCIKYLGDEADAKDATLELFEKLVTDLKKVEVEKFNNWLHVVSRNHCLMILRKSKKYQSRSLDSSINGFEDHSQEKLEDAVLSEARFELLEEAIDKLNDGQQECIRLFYLDKLPYQSVCDRTGFDMKQVKSYIQNGKKNLKTMLSQHHEFRVR